MAHGIAPAQAASKPPLIVPGVARGAEHGARQCTGAILYEEIALAANERPNWRSGRHGLLSADPRALPGFLAHPRRMSTPGGRMDSIHVGGSLRAVLCPCSRATRRPSGVTSAALRWPSGAGGSGRLRTGGLGHARRVAWTGLRAAGGAIRSSLVQAEAGMGRLLARERTGAAGVQQQQRQQELQHDGPMLVEQLEHGDDEDGVPQQSAREESGSGSGRVDGEDERGTRAGMRGDRGLAQRKICMHAGGFRG